MHNTNVSNLSGNNYHDEDKYFDNNLPPMVDNDFIMNYLDNPELAQRRYNPIKCYLTISIGLFKPQLPLTNLPTICHSPS